MGMHILKTEHAGAKNGGGYYGPRADAKALSRVKRRSDDRRAVKAGLLEPTGEECASAPLDSTT